MFVVIAEGAAAKAFPESVMTQLQLCPLANVPGEQAEHWFRRGVGDSLDRLMHAWTHAAIQDRQKASQSFHISPEEL
jgi:hypothetical protein